MADKYKELIHQYSYDTDEKGRVTGSRTFIVVPDGTSGSVASLPVRGMSLLPDESGSDITGCTCRRIRVKRDADDLKPQYVAMYDSESSTSASGSIGITSDGDSRTFDIQPELMSINSLGSGWNWDLQSLAIEASIPVYKRAVMISFTISKPALTTSAKNALITTIRSKAGCINSGSFEGFAEGQVYFEGCRGGDYVDEGGTRKWNLEMVFTARLLTGELDYNGNPITQDDWLYLYADPEGGVGDFDKPKKGSNYLYQKVSFSDLD